MIHVNPNSKKIKYALLLVIPFLVVSCLVFLSNKLYKDISASTYTDITTQITVGNSAPSFTSGPAENTASTNTAPTSIGGTVQFNATATDANGESYYLIVCSTNSVTAGSGGASPTCGATTYCKNTTPVSSGTSTSCSYTTQASDAWSNAWYAFVCDNNSTVAACSASSQGSGDTGSPFFVNHPPSFTAISSNTPRNPGTSVTWTTTASDPDTGSTVELLVCKTNAMSSGACTGGAWCTSTAVASDPSCSYSIPVPTPDGANTAYVYVVDQFNLAATGAAQGTTSNFTVSNVAPVVSSVVINGGSNIALTEGTTTAVTITADVTDNNSCYGAEISSVLMNLYSKYSHSTNGDLQCGSCTAPGYDVFGERLPSDCFYDVSCSVVVGSCTGTSDSTASYTCTVNMPYYASPTDLYTGTQNWQANVTATDNNSATGSSSDTEELLSLLGGSASPTLLDYGTLTVGTSNDPLDKVITTSPTGNLVLDQQHNATGSNLCVNYSACTGGTPIPITYQKYSLTSSTSYASGTALSTTATTVQLDLPRQIDSTVPTKNTYWGIFIPNNIVSGVYNGLNVITYVSGMPGSYTSPGSCYPRPPI